MAAVDIRGDSRAVHSSSFIVERVEIARLRPQPAAGRAKRSVAPLVKAPR